MWIAFSGGLDSSALLACAARSTVARQRGLQALHVHHGLHADADAWADQALAFAERWGVPCTVARVQVDARGLGIEAAAREARLAAFARQLSPGACMILAHHQNDQAETLLLRLLRGASVDGLGAMRAQRRLGVGFLLRPWLAQPRSVLQAFAQSVDLAWVEDPANFDARFDRSYLRQQLWPLLDGRFPALAERLARLAEHAASVSEELEESAQRTLSALGGASGNALQIPGLLALSDALFGACLRRFARERDVAPPGFHELRRIRAEVLLAASDGNPILRWDGHEFRRYRDTLYLLPQAATRKGPAQALEWPIGVSALRLPDDLGELRLFDAAHQPSPAPCALQVRWRRGGERLRPEGGTHTRELRLIFQELGVPTWQRERVPLLCLGSELLAAVGCVSSARLAELWPMRHVEWAHGGPCQRGALT